MADDHNVKVYINDIDLASYGLWMSAESDVFNAPDTADQMIGVAGRAGGVIVGEEVAIEPRSATLRGVMIQSSPAAAAAALDLLKKEIGGVFGEVRTSLYPDRVLFARVRGPQWAPRQSNLFGGDVQIGLSAPDPFWYALSEDYYVLPTGQPVPITLGTAPHGIGFIIWGAATNPVLTLTTPAGLVLETITLVGSLSAGDRWEIDGITWEMRHVTAGGVVTNAANILAAGSGHFFTLDPRGGGAVVTVTGTSGPALTEAFVRRAFQ